MKKLSFNMALGGIFSAVCLLMMFAVGILPAFLYVFPMICGLIMYVIYYECGVKTAIVSYACVSLLSLIISPDKESTLLFVTFFGYYPIFKVYLDTMRSRLIKLMIKLALFNASVIGTYFLLINVIGFVSLEDFTGDAGSAMIWAFLALGNIVFIMYDVALGRVAILYNIKLRKLLFKRTR